MSVCHPFSSYLLLCWIAFLGVPATSNIFSLDLNKWIWNSEWRINLPNIPNDSTEFHKSKDSFFMEWFFFRFFFISYKLLSSLQHLSNVIVQELMLGIEFFSQQFLKKNHRSKKIICFFFFEYTRFEYNEINDLFLF